MQAAISNPGLWMVSRMDRKILVAVASKPVRSEIAGDLASQGHSVRSAANADELIGSLRYVLYDLIILDLCLSVQTRVDILRLARELAPEIKIIILSPRRSYESALKSLRYQASDYLVSPVSPQRLLRSIRRLFPPERQGPVPAGVEGLTDESISESGVYLRSDGVRIDLRLRTIEWDDAIVRLTVSEARLLTVFLENPGRVLTHAQLVRMVQEFDASDVEAPLILRPLVSRLRQKTSQVPGGDEWIINIRGTGYMYERRAQPPA